MSRYEEADRSEERRAHQLRGAREGIMLAAARVVAKAGYQATTMRTIAKEAGYTASSLYTYFKSKEEIFQALRDDLLTRVQATLQEDVPEGLDFPARVAVLAHRMARLTDEFQDALAVHLLGGVDLPDEDGALRLQKLRRIKDLFTAWFERNATPGELGGHSAEDAGLLFHGLQRAYLERAILDGNGVLEAAALKSGTARALAYFLAALGAPTG